MEPRDKPCVYLGTTERHNDTYERHYTPCQGIGDRVCEEAFETKRKDYVSVSHIEDRLEVCGESDYERPY